MARHKRWEPEGTICKRCGLYYPPSYLTSHKCQCGGPLISASARNARWDPALVSEDEEELPFSDPPLDDGDGPLPF
jgi:hypothetical protein